MALGILQHIYHLVFAPADSLAVTSSHVSSDSCPHSFSNAGALANSDDNANHCSHTAALTNSNANANESPHCLPFIVANGMANANSHDSSHARADDICSSLA